MGRYGSREVARLVECRETAAGAEEQAEIEEQIEAYVAEALGLTQQEQEAIREWCAGEANWEARDRVRAPSEDGYNREADHSGFPGSRCASFSKYHHQWEQGAFARRRRLFSSPNTATLS